MKLYLADIGVQFRALHSRGVSFSGANILQSFFYCDEFTTQTLIPDSRSFLLDSGAFTFIRGNSDVDWIRYVDEYSEFIDRNDIELFFELDIDALVGLAEVEKLRDRLQKRTGKTPIPVFHKPRGKQYFIDMCKEYDYVALGGIAKGLDTKPGDERFFPWFIDKAHEHGAKIHGLGFTPCRGLAGRYRFDSVDSSSWTAGGRYGELVCFRGTCLTRARGREGRRIRNYKDAAEHNFKEWQKYAEYLDAR